MTCWGLTNAAAIAVQKYGENEPLVSELRRKIDEVGQLKLSGQDPQILEFQADFHEKKG